MKTLLKWTAYAALAGVAVTQGLRAVRRTDFRGKVVFITGGSRGFGLILARHFGEAGAKLAICARDADELGRAETELRERGFEVRSYVCDVADKAQVETTIDAITRDLGPIDVLVNNAAVMTLGPLETMELSDFEREMDISFKSQLYTTLYMIPSMKARGEGRIINISSVGGRVPIPHLVPYSAVKHAISGLSQGLRTELTRHGVYVTTVWPYIMRTGSFYNADMKGDHEKELTIGAIYNALPVTSMSAERVARGVLQACRDGVATYNPSYRAGFFFVFYSLFPNVVAELLSLVPRLMPKPDWDRDLDPKTPIKGHEVTTGLAPSAVTTFNDEEAVRNNQLSAEWMAAEKN